MMGLISSGIERVRAFALAAGIVASGRTVNEPVSVLIKWRSEHEDKLHQVYINGELSGVTADCQQRMIVGAIRSGLTSSARVEVDAVEPCERDIDFSDELDSFVQARRVEISWLRVLSLPFEGQSQVFSDGGSGQIDYESPVTKEGLRLWPGWQDKGGFGLSTFGLSDFGYDGSASVGFGRGYFGQGQFGFDADQIKWQSSELVTGRYKFGVKIMDRAGNSSTGTETETITMILAAQGAEELEAESYDKGQNKLILSVN